MGIKTFLQERRSIRVKYSLDEAAGEIGRRRDRIIHHRKRRSLGLLATFSALTLFALGAAFYELTGFGETGGERSVYGALMLPNEAGGYILVGVLCFVAAVIITLLCIKYRSRSESGHGDGDAKEN